MGRPTTVALTLGAGGARGYAHIGVIEALEERGYEIVTVAGTSMGALVGGLHATGSLQAYADWARTLTQRDVLRLLDPTLRGPGAIRATKVFAKVAELLGDVRIEDLPIPYTAVATDLLAGKEVWFQRGPLAPAIRASIALPRFITPVVIGGRLLADGGMMNPIPVAATAATPADLTIAVSLAEEHVTGRNKPATNVSSSLEELEDVDEAAVSETTSLLDSERVRSLVDWFTDGRLDPQAPVDHEPVEDAPEDWGLQPPPAGLRTRDVMQLSLDALQGVVTRYRLAGYPPDLLVTIPRAACRTFDFHRASELIALGRDRMLEALDGERSTPWA